MEKGTVTISTEEYNELIKIKDTIVNDGIVIESWDSMNCRIRKTFLSKDKALNVLNDSIKNMDIKIVGLNTELNENEYSNKSIFASLSIIDFWEWRRRFRKDSPSFKFSKFQLSEAFKKRNASFLADSDLLEPEINNQSHIRQADDLIDYLHK